jgi:hypothetical protein
MPYFRGEPPALHPVFAPGSAAEIVPHAEGPIVFDAQRIEYSEEDERALEAYARATGACETTSISCKDDLTVCYPSLPPKK